MTNSYNELQPHVVIVDVRKSENNMVFNVNMTIID